MQKLPHRYLATATAAPSGYLTLASDGLPPLSADAPAAFGGPGDQWSPETLLVASIGGCLALTFRAVARGARLPYTSIRCHVDGTLDRVDRVTSFTAFQVTVSLEVPPTVTEEEAQAVLRKAKEHCLITNSLRGDVTFTTTVTVADEEGVGAALQ